MTKTKKKINIKALKMLNKRKYKISLNIDKYCESILTKWY